LKNFICESTSATVDLLRTTYRNSKEPFKEICDHMFGIYYEQQWTFDQQMITHPTARPRRAQKTAQDTDEEIDQDSDIRMVACGQQRSDDLRISDALWTNTG
jgi:hypothetical protein